MPFVPDPRDPVPFEPTEVQLRYMRAPGPIAGMVNDYLLTFFDMDMPVSDEQLARMLDAAEAKYLRHADQLPPPRPPQRMTAGAHDPVVYYFRLGDLVKIGTTGDIRQRRLSVPCQGVMAVERGSYELESQRHDQFVDLHQWREWFRLDAALGPHIADVREQFEREVGMTTESWLDAPF